MQRGDLSGHARKSGAKETGMDLAIERRSARFVEGVVNVSPKGVGWIQTSSEVARSCVPHSHSPNRRDSGIARYCR